MENIYDKINCESRSWDSEDSLTIDGKRIRALIDVDSRPVSSRRKDGSVKEFIIIEFNISIDPSECFTSNTDEDVYWFARNYQLLVQPWDIPRRKSVKIVPDQLSPTTSLGTTSITSGSTLSLGADVGFFGKTVTGGGNVSYSISNSRTYNLPDVTVRQRIFGAGYTGVNSEESIGVIWDFTLRDPEFTSGLFQRATWHSPPDIATSTFNIMACLVYEIDPSIYEGAESFRIATQLSVEMGKAHVSGDPFGDYIHKSMESKILMASFPTEISRPPMPEE